MTRWVSSAAQTAAAEKSIVMVTLVDLDFPSGNVRAHDGAGTLTFGGNDYTGVGQYGGIDAVMEGLEIIARPLKLTLSGVDASLVETTMTEDYQDEAVTVYVGVLNKDTMQFVADPEEVWGGRMDTMSIEVDEGLAVITLNCEHRLRREPRIARYTNQDHQLAYPGDTFFSFLYRIPFSRSMWGAWPTTFPWDSPPSRPRGGRSVGRPAD